MTTEAVKTEQASTELAQASVEVKQAALELAQAGTTEGVWRCSCGYESEKMEGLGGHLRQHQMDKSNHKNLGFGPSSKPAAEPAIPAGETKSKVKAKKPAGEKAGRTTTNIDEAALIVVSPVVLFLLYDCRSC
jgi:hypothetical protein